MTRLPSSGIRNAPRSSRRTSRATIRGVACAASLWSIIERVRATSAGIEAECAAFRAELEALDDASLKVVVAEFDALTNRAYDYGLWGAAYVARGGCGDDKFSDFRAGLVSLGREVYERALEDPDTLADVPDLERRFSEEFHFLPATIVDERGLAHPEGPGLPGEPTGYDWDEDELPFIYPRLTKRFGG